MISSETSLYRILVWVAIGIGVFVIGSLVFDYLGGSDDEGMLNYRRGNLRLEDGLFKDALVEFNQFLQIHDADPLGYLGRGLALVGMGENDQAMEAFNTALALDENLGAVYANRGILFDRMGRHEEAAQDYRRALELDEELGEGPGWLTRFFRNQWEAPPTIRDRMVYLEKELAKPPAERLLQVPEIDEKQRSYKLEK